MPKYPAIALFEFATTPAGAVVADAMAKAAPLDHFQVGTVQPGRYLILLGGQVAALEEAITAGQRVAPQPASDWILLPDIDPDVHAAVLGRRRTEIVDALAVVETERIPRIVAATDAAVKSASVQVLEMRLGDGLGGRGLVHLGGLLADVEAAVEVVRERIGDPQAVQTQVISNVSDGLAGAFGRATRFGGA